jgi:hypothetical protein
LETEREEDLEFIIYIGYKLTNPSYPKKIKTLLKNKYLVSTDFPYICLLHLSEEFSFLKPNLSVCTHVPIRSKI